MEVSFNGIRRNIANAFNSLVKEEVISKDSQNLKELRMHIQSLLLIYDPEIKGDCDDLGDEIQLESLPEDD